MTTLAEIETTARRIEEFLERPAAVDAAARKLAADYFAAGRAAAARLNQCAAMLSAGDEHQALQLAETQPALLDLITLLSFRRSPQWRAFCRSENLPEPESFDVKALRRLNDTYAKGIDTDHALYRDYRRAVMLNDDAAALGILRSIARLNPNDNNAKGELERLEKKQWSLKAQKLEALAKVNDPAEATQIARLVDELEGAHVALDSPGWYQAQGVRAGVLMQRMREAQRAGALKETKAFLEKLATQRHLLNQPDRAFLDEMERWAELEAERRKEAADRKAALDHLAAVANRLEQEQFGSRKRKLAELRAEADALERAWGQALRFRSEVNREFAARVEKMKSALESEINRTVRASRRVALAAVAVVVVICVAGAWWAYERQAAHALAIRVERMVGERRVGEMEAALAHSPMGTSPALERARLLAGGFLQREKALKAAWEERLAYLEAARRQGFTNEPPEKIAAAFAAARMADKALAPEFRNVADSALGKLDASWNEFVERGRSAASERLNAMTAPVEKAAESELRYDRDAKEVLEAAERLRQALESARNLVQTPVLRPKQEALFRLETLQARIEKTAREATNWFAGNEGLARATNLESYNAALQMLASSGFTPATDRVAANAMAGLNLSSRTLLGPLLLPNGPQSVLLEAPRGSRVPAQVLPAEKEIQRRLRDDPNIHAVSRIELEVKALTADDPRRKRVVYLRGELQRRITRKSGAIYDPVESPSALNFAQKEMGSLDYSVDEPSTPSEKELYDRVGLSRLLDSNTGQYQVSLLQALDDINQDRRANPLFRAYLIARILEMIDAQPVEWGAVWSPALAKDRAELNRIGIAQIHSGDWFVPAKTTQRAASLTAFFERAGQHSYAREAAFFKRIFPKTMEAGVRLVGYVSAEGKPILTNSQTPGAVWGLRAVGALAEVLVQNGQARGAGAPFSPLFVFAGNAVELVDSALQELSYSGAAAGLMENLPGILKGGP